MQWLAALGGEFVVVFLIVGCLGAAALFVGIAEHWIIIIVRFFFFFLSVVRKLMITFVPTNNKVVTAFLLCAAILVRIPKGISPFTNLHIHVGSFINVEFINARDCKVGANG